MVRRDVLPLGDDDVRVWYWRTGSIGDADLIALIDTLSVDERERYHSYRFAHDRRDFAAAHALLRRVLSGYGGLAPAEWQFEANVQGKPALATEHATDLTFNLSHTRGLVACAVARHAAVGIDVEWVDRIATGRDIATHYFSPAEIRALDRAPSNDYRRWFIEVWTLKEAYIKGVGLGLAHPLDTFSFIVGGDGGMRFEAPPDATTQSWQFLLARLLPDYRLALAVERNADSPDCQITLMDANCQELTDGGTDAFQVISFRSRRSSGEGQQGMGPQSTRQSGLLSPREEKTSRS
jgi:4'-phosphopantetheinyl transferase